MNYFCTYCDQGYAARLICLHDSLLAQREPFRLYVLCFDRKTEAVVMGVGKPSLVAISLDEVLSADPDYSAVRGQRTVVEFYFTSTPVFVRYCLSRESAAGQMTYLDSDLFFFGPPSAVFNVQGDASIGIISHRFPARLAELVKHGKYNVAWVSFRRDRDGLACLEWWRARCLEWCHDHIDQGRFADQGYLDDFPKLFNGVRVLDHPGVNAAPWNMDAVQISEQDQQLFVNGRRLLFYHFQGIRELLPGRFESGLRNYQTKLTPALRSLIYLPYLKNLTANQQRLRADHDIAPRLGYQRLPLGKFWLGRWARKVQRRLLPHFRRFRGDLLHCPESTLRASAKSYGSGSSSDVR